MDVWEKEIDIFISCPTKLLETFSMPHWTLVFGGARYNGPNASAVKMNYVHLFFCFLYFVFEYGPICNIHYPIKLK